MHCVYILKSGKTGKLYIGVTADLKQRLKSHNAGKNRSTRHGRPWKLKYCECYASRHDAEKREKGLKHHGRVYANLKRRIRDSLDEEE